MKKFTYPEVELIRLDSNDILTTSSLCIGDPIGAGHPIVNADAPARIGIFDAPAPETNSNGIW